MALTQGQWTRKPSGRYTMQYTCNVAFTIAENDAYTLKTPRDLNCNKEFVLLISCAATPDGIALPLDIWGGYGSDFALSGNDTTVAATNGVKIKQVFDDVVLAVSPLIYSFTFDPDLPVADVVTVAAIGSGPKIRIPKFDYYAFNLNGGSTLNATNCDFTLIQAQR